MSMEDIRGCFSVAPPLILLPYYSKLGKMTLWRLLRSKRNLGMASNILSSTLGQRLMSVEDIGGCFSVAPPLILLLNYSKLSKMTLWRLLRSKQNLGTASNILSSTLGQILMSVEDIGGCFSVAPPLVLILNYSKLGKMTLWRLLWSKRNLGTASNIFSSTLGQIKSINSFHQSLKFGVLGHKLFRLFIVWTETPCDSLQPLHTYKPIHC